MLRLNNLGIATRIAIVCLIPLIAFTAFAGKDLLDKRADLASAESIAVVAEAAPMISNLVHELQKERGASAGFINSAGKSLADTLRNQRPATDQKLASSLRQMDGLIKSSAGSKFARDLEDARSKLGGLQATRDAVGAFSITSQKSTEYYSATIASLIAIIDSISEMSEQGRIVRQAATLSSHVRRKEFAGQERATGSVGFTSGKFAQETYQVFTRAGNLGEAHAAAFRRNATPVQVEYVANVLKGAVQDDLLRMRAIAAASPFSNNMQSVSGAQWFETATRYIDALKTAEDHLSADFISVVREVADDARRGFWGMLALFVGLLAVTGFLASLIALSITRPISQLVGTMGELAQGHNDVEVQGTERRDEIGRMARAVLVFRDAAVEKLRVEDLAAEQRRLAEEERRRNAEFQAKAAKEQADAVRALAAGLEKVSEGDLRVRLSDGFTDTYKQIRDDFNSTIERLQETIRSIAASTREVAGTATEISSSTTSLSQRTEEQAASLEETAASMEEISATVQKNAENARQANQFANSTREIANRGSAVVAQAVSAMARIEGSSHKISDIISVMDEIARQTNLLALNAAVEAARAGEAGRGFAVVASEVRSLAQRSSQAAKDIKDLITSSSSQVEEGVELVNRAGTSLTEIVESIKRAAEIVADIAAASGEQSTGIDQVNAALSQMDVVTQQNSALVEENAAAAKSLEQQAQGMDQQVGFFQFDDAQAASTSSVVTHERSDATHLQPAATAEYRRLRPHRARAVVGVGAFANDSAWRSSSRFAAVSQRNEDCQR
jgi:methyl-accepting chemotaxis protein